MKKMKSRYVCTLINSTPIPSDEGAVDLLIDLLDVDGNPYIEILITRNKTDFVLHERLQFDSMKGYRTFLEKFLGSLEPFEKSIFWTDGSMECESHLKKWLENHNKISSE